MFSFISYRRSLADALADGELERGRDHHVGVDVVHLGLVLLGEVGFLEEYSRSEKGFFVVILVLNLTLMKDWYNNIVQYLYKSFGGGANKPPIIEK